MGSDDTEQLEQICAEPHGSDCVKGGQGQVLFPQLTLLTPLYLRRVVECPQPLYLILQLLCMTCLLPHFLGYCCSRSAAVECSQYRITIIYSVFSSLVGNELFSCFY